MLWVCLCLRRLPRLPWLPLTGVSPSIVLPVRLLRPAMPGSNPIHYHKKRFPTGVPFHILIQKPWKNRPGQTSTALCRVVSGDQVPTPDRKYSCTYYPTLFQKRLQCYTGIVSNRRGCPFVLQPPLVPAFHRIHPVRHSSQSSNTISSESGFHPNRCTSKFRVRADQLY